MEETQKLLDYLKGLSEVANDNYSNILQQLLEFKAVWHQCDPETYYRCVNTATDCYIEANKLDDALQLLSEEMAWFSENYPFETVYISRLYYNQGQVFAFQNHHIEAVRAFMAGIYYNLTSNESYSGFNFYSFRSPSQFTIDDLANNVITVVSPSQFNDPVDCMVFPWLDYKQNAECVMERDKRMMKAITEAYSHLKVRCFVSRQKLPTMKGEMQKSLKDTPEQFDTLMWSHYAQNHTGICVQYCLPKSITEADKELLTVSRLANVHYASTGDVTKDMSLRQAFFTKSKKWEYEDEVRLLHYDPTWNTDFKPIKLPQGSVKAVYFGLKCTEDTKNKIRKALKYENVDYYQIGFEPKNIYQLKASKV